MFHYIFIKHKKALQQSNDSNSLMPYFIELKRNMGSHFKGYMYGQVKIYMTETLKRFYVDFIYGIFYFIFSYFYCILIQIVSSFFNIKF